MHWSWGCDTIAHFRIFLKIIHHVMKLNSVASSITDWTDWTNVPSACSDPASIEISQHPSRFRIASYVLCTVATGDPQSSCLPTTELPVLLSRYNTGGRGQLACSEGMDVLYPAGAPGFAYDPTGASNSTVCAVIVDSLSLGMQQVLWRAVPWLRRVYISRRHI